MSKKYSCPKCEYSTNDSGNFKKHFDSVHLGKRPFKCPYENCDHSTTQSCHLKLHINSVHLGLKPFKCTAPNCQYSASKPCHLRDHINTQHMGLRLYKCKFCPFKSGTSSNLKKHELLHLKKKVFECPVCTKQYSYLKARDAHIQKLHKDFDLAKYKSKNDADDVDELGQTRDQRELDNDSDEVVEVECSSGLQRELRSQRSTSAQQSASASSRQSLDERMALLESEFEKFAEKKKLLLQNYRKTTEEIRGNLGALVSQLENRRRHLLETAKMHVTSQIRQINAEMLEYPISSQFGSSVEASLLELNKLMVFRSNGFESILVKLRNFGRLGIELKSSSPEASIVSDDHDSPTEDDDTVTSKNAPLKRRTQSWHGKKLMRVSIRRVNSTASKSAIKTEPSEPAQDMPLCSKNLRASPSSQTD